MNPLLPWASNQLDISQHSKKHLATPVSVAGADHAKGQQQDNRRTTAGQKRNERRTRPGHPARPPKAGQSGQQQDNSKAKRGQNPATEPGHRVQSVRPGFHPISMSISQAAGVLLRRLKCHCFATPGFQSGHFVPPTAMLQTVSESEQMTYILIFGFAVSCSHLQPLAATCSDSHLQPLVPQASKFQYCQYCTLRSLCKNCKISSSLALQKVRILFSEKSWIFFLSRLFLREFGRLAALTVSILACPQMCEVQNPKSQEAGASGSGGLNVRRTALQKSWFSSNCMRRNHDILRTDVAFTRRCQTK